MCSISAVSKNNYAGKVQAVKQLTGKNTLKSYRYNKKFFILVKKLFSDTNGLLFSVCKMQVNVANRFDAFLKKKYVLMLEVWSIVQFFRSLKTKLISNIPTFVELFYFSLCVPYKCSIFSHWSI